MVNKDKTLTVAELMTMLRPPARSARLLVVGLFSGVLKSSSQPTRAV